MEEVGVQSNTLKSTRSGSLGAHTYGVWGKGLVFMVSTSRD